MGDIIKQKLAKLKQLKEKQGLTNGTDSGVSSKVLARPQPANFQQQMRIHFNLENKEPNLQPVQAINLPQNKDMKLASNFVKPSLTIEPPKQHSPAKAQSPIKVISPVKVLIKPEETKERKLQHPFQRRKEDKSTLQEAEERCPEETKKRCFERVNEMLQRRDNESKQSKKGQRYLISQSPLMVRDGSVILDDIETPEILKSLNFIELHEDSHVSDVKPKTQIEKPMHQLILDGIKRKSEEFMSESSRRQRLSERPRMKLDQPVNQTMIQIHQVQLDKPLKKLHITNSHEAGYLDQYVGETQEAQIEEEHKVEVQPISHKYTTALQSSKGRKSEFELSNFNQYLGLKGSDQKSSSEYRSESHMLKVEGSQYPNAESPVEERASRLPLTFAKRANNLTMCITGSTLTDQKIGLEIGADDEYSESYVI